MTLTSVIRRVNEEAEDSGTPKWMDPRHGKEVVPHGFRSTFRDWAAERTNFPNEMVEMALAHAIDSKVEAAYRRGDLFNKRRCVEGVLPLVGVLGVTPPCLLGLDEGAGALVEGLGCRRGEERFGPLFGATVDRVDLLSPQLAAVIRRRSGVRKAHVGKGTKAHVPLAPLYGVAKHPALCAGRADLQIEASAVGQISWNLSPRGRVLNGPIRQPLDQLPHRLSSFLSPR
jgi:hypothetical protein